jgi:hypothetical protein
MVEARESNTALVPVGNDNFCRHFYDSLLQKIKVLLVRISRMEHTQSAFQVLVLSANARIGHLLRTNSATSPNSPLARFIKQFDDSILECFQTVLACPVLSDIQISQTRLPERLSGLGLLSAEITAPAAFIGSARQAISELSHRGLAENVLSRAFQHHQLNENVPWCLDICQNWNKYALNISNNNPSLAVEAWSSNMFLTLQPQHLQRNLSERVMHALQHKIKQSSSPLDIIRINSCAATGSGAF